MVPEFAAWTRDQIGLSDIISAVGIAVVLSFLGVDLNVIGTLLGIAIGAPLLEGVFDRYDVDPALAWLGLGLFTAAVGGIQLREGGYWFGGSLLAVGCWICLDGLYARRTDGSSGTDEDLTDDDYHLAALHSGWLLEELREADRPLTKTELCDRTGLLAEDFDRLLEIHGESGAIERTGNGYAIDEDEMGSTAAVRSLLRTVKSRLFRPFRLFRPAGYR
ncbi:hypothetical protein CP556_01120 [Natrinema sp. CBA1119]|uniref:hypothetical protein n=1 Tax=Natrinema sp. CBA1119 TaxID=1608465 RepID=UPI000BF5432D|nr:hypothetical protein [Natrinema sp. CBA1119]PGF14857.1 hypothetical protein CP556_01120 [Natrinema sp. CBA1119]